MSIFFRRVRLFLRRLGWRAKTELAPEKIQDTLNRSAILELSDEQKRDTAVSIQKRAKISRLFILEVALSTVIASFGLLQNSAAVIIGAMLIAPLLRPIQGLAFGIATGRTRLTLRSGRTLLIGVALAVGLSLLFSLLVPARSETAEVLGRTAPNLLDLVIAGSSASVAFLSIRYSQLAEGVAGVAMATSLLPPLAVVGIELGFGHMAAAGGAMLLFLTNLIAILVVGWLLFLLFGYAPHVEQQKSYLQQLGILFVLAVIIVIPLFGALRDIAFLARVDNRSKLALADTFRELEIPAVVSGLRSERLRDDQVLVQANLQIPEAVEVTDDVLSALQRGLSDATGEDIILEAGIVRTARVASSSEILAEAAAERQRAQRQRVERVIEGAYPGAHVFDLSLNQVAAEDDGSERGLVSVVLSIPGGLTTTAQQDLEDTLRAEVLPNETNWVFAWNLVAGQSVAEVPTTEDIYRDFLVRSIGEQIGRAFSGAVELVDSEIVWRPQLAEEVEFAPELIERYVLLLSLRVEEGLPPEGLSERIELILADILDRPFAVELSIERFERVQIDALSAFE